MSKSRNLICFSLGKHLLTIFVASLIAMPSAHGRLTAQHSQLWSQDSPGIDETNAPLDGFGSALTSCDFNGDGNLDLAIGTPREGGGFGGNTGAVTVIYGGDIGLSSDSSQLIQLSDLPGYAPEPGDQFGYALASGNFNGDRYCDLAIGARDRDISGKVDAGAVYVVHGAFAGLNVALNQEWSQASAGIQGDPEDDDRFGWSLAVGDFDGNGKDDLAMGVPYEDIGTVDKAGFVNIIYAADDNSGLTSVGNRGFLQGDALNNSRPGVGDFFGMALAAGDFDGNGKDDLAVGVPWEDIGDEDGSGVVHVIYGANNGSGLNEAGNQVWKQGDGIRGVPESGDTFGSSLAVGDFDGNGKDDLAVGVPQENIGTISAGVVNVIYGAGDGSGLDEAGDQMWSQGDGIPATSEYFDDFGRSLAVGDFNGDGKDDLVVGIPKEDIEQPPLYPQKAGAIVAIYGAGNGLSVEGSQLWTQFGSEGYDIAGEPASDEYFGNALAVGDFDDNGLDDLAVGVPGPGSPGQAGEVSVIYANKNYGSLGLALTTPSPDVSEGNAAELLVFRTGGSQEQVAVRLTTEDRTASAVSGDYAAVSRLVSFADGEIQKTVTIGTYDDGLIESWEDFSVKLSDPEGGATLKPESTSLSIRILDKQSCLQGTERWEVSAPKSYFGKFYCAADYIRVGDLSSSGSSVTVEPTGWLMFSAPRIYLWPGFKVKLGGELHLGYPIHP